MKGCSKLYLTPQKQYNEGREYVWKLKELMKTPLSFTFHM